MSNENGARQFKATKDFSQFSLAGRIASDPEFRYTPTGVAVLDFRMAHNRLGKKRADGSYEGVTKWCKVTIWRDAADRLSNVLKKGMGVIVEVSDFDTSAWVDKTSGEARASLDLTAFNITIIKWPKDGTQPEGDTYGDTHSEPTAEIEGSDLPF
jgi:single-strand DNA-binding protein